MACRRRNRKSGGSRSPARRSRRMARRLGRADGFRSTGNAYDRRRRDPRHSCLSGADRRNRADPDGHCRADRRDHRRRCIDGYGASGAPAVGRDGGGGAGALDTVVPVTSQDEIGRLTHAFNNMVGELRVKAQIRETFGKYVDPRMVAGLIDRPELTGPEGSRREMTILFCDMKGFTSFSEGMTPVGLVNVLNRYLSVISEPVRRNRGIIDKYIGDAVMAFWGPPFTGAEEQARLACLAALEQLAALPAFQAELPDLMGVRRGVPEVAIRVGIATGEVVVGNIGSEQTRSYTVIGDTVNFASRLEGAGKAYGTRVLISEAPQRLAAESVETRAIDTVLVVGKSEPERIFELLGRKGEVAAERLELRDAFEAALVSYRAQAWEAAEAGFGKCLAIDPEDRPSQIFLARIAHFREQPPAVDWNGAWV